MSIIDRTLPDAPWIREAELYGLPDTDDAWDRDNPDWATLADLISDWWSERIPDLVRDYLQYDGDLMCEIFEAGLLADWVNPAVRMDDPDEEWHEVDRIFDCQWNNDSLMMEIWDWLPDSHMEKLIKDLRNDNDLRKLYNEKGA